MLITTRGRYALRIMVDLAENQKDDWVPLRQITDRQEVSEKYLESIIRPLSKAGLLLAERGKGGGYRLARLPEEYPISEILTLVESFHPVVACLRDEENQCARSCSCKTLPLWSDLQIRLERYFSSITVADLCNEAFDFKSVKMDW